MTKVELEFPNQREELMVHLRQFSTYEAPLIDHTGSNNPYACSYNFNYCYIFMEMLNFENSREEYATGTLFYTIEEYRAVMDFFWACDRLEDSIDYTNGTEIRNEVIQGNPRYKEVVQTAQKALAILTSYKGLNK